MFKGPAARIGACGAALVVVGCGILSQFDGWLGIGLWTITAPLVCIGLELALRPKTKPRPAARTGPTLVVKLGRKRSAAPPPKASPPSPFVWHSQKSRRRAR